MSDIGNNHLIESRARLFFTFVEKVVEVIVAAVDYRIGTA